MIRDRIAIWWWIHMIETGRCKYVHAIPLIGTRICFYWEDRASGVQ
jgi:hypothetical protein